MKPAINGVKDPVALRLDAVRANVALVGYFDPRALVDLRQSPEIARKILRILARICDEVPFEKGIRWQLTPDCRRSTLRELSELKQLRKLARRLKAAPGDMLGYYLIKLASGERLNIETLSTEDLSYLYTAQQFLEHLPEGRLSSAKINRVFALREFKDSLNIALPTGLFGREEELNRLSRYLFQGENGGGVGKVEPIYLTGLGGAGKSALLAAFAQRLLSEKIPVIWFDFDRAAFSQADTDLMTLEFSRQLGQLLPTLTDALTRFREQAREVIGQQYNIENYDSGAYSTSNIWSIWQEEMAPYLPLHQPIALVLDTFEEVLLRGRNTHTRLRTWMTSLREEGGLWGMRPLLSGRVLPDDLLKDQGARYEHIALGSLNPDAAYAMLHQLLLGVNVSVEERLCRRMIEEWGSSPLFIRLLARDLGEENGVQEAVESLRRGEFAGVPHALVRGFTYQRVLNRLRTNDPDLRKLAHMGLILRRVSAQLINEVLAAPCGLPAFDEERAAQLFSTLASHVWLVEETGNNQVVRHRRDLRNVMLGLMQPADRAIAHGIHLRAQVYYSSGADPFLTKAEQNVEADYHRLFISDFDLDLFAMLSKPRQLVESLGDELHSLPLQRRAWLKSQMKYELSEEESNSLSTEDRISYQSEQISQTLKSGGVTIPRTDYGQLTVEDGSRMDSDLPSSIAASFSSVSLRAINKLRYQVIDDFFQMIAMGRSSRAYAVDFCDTPIWRVALAALYSGERDGLYAAIRECMSGIQFIEWERPIRADKSNGFDVATAVRMLVGLCGIRDYRPHNFSRSQRPRQRTHTNDELKALLLSIQHDSEVHETFPAPIATGLLCDLTPEFIRGVEGELPELLVHDPSLERLMANIRGGADPKLAHFQRKASSSGYVEFHRRSINRSGFKKAFRPLYPELYPHIRGAFRGANFALLTFARQTESYVPVWPTELKADSLEKSLLRDSARWTATLIHFADRCGLLHPLLKHVVHLSHKNVAALEALRLYEVYDQAVMGIESFEDNRHGGWFAHSD